ncbi:hypothetical protein CEXT_14561 [Caerostris extrusa]|uniref:Uncharacterized protein n=1 Tax=Caerostris extrusa TaxID=172846 RepID=A0AAV4WZ87_CAEEX|nr:hypothetical protein CEXT_14561 [Caerostris extrusa]
MDCSSRELNCTAWIPTGVPGTAFPAATFSPVGTPPPPPYRTTGAEAFGYVGTCASWEDRCQSTRELSVARLCAVLLSPEGPPLPTQQPWRKRLDDSFTGKIRIPDGLVTSGDDGSSSQSSNISLWPCF